MLKTFANGIIKENPVLVVLLGLCPTLAVSVRVENAIGMGAAATFVLMCSNTIISLFGRFFPSKIRIPCYIVVIATFVTVVEMVMGAWLPALNESLGIFIPLIVVNCIILGRAEAFASRHGLLLSIADGLGMGLGFGLALTVIAAVREFLGTGKLLGKTIFESFSAGGAVAPVSVMVLAPGAFIVIAFLIAFTQRLKRRLSARGL